jgi:hypothetical protein
MSEYILELVAKTLILQETIPLSAPSFATGRLD